MQDAYNASLKTADLRGIGMFNGWRVVEGFRWVSSELSLME